jgi:hypothetical protein
LARPWRWPQIAPRLTRRKPVNHPPQSRHPSSLPFFAFKSLDGERNPKTSDFRFCAAQRSGERDMATCPSCGGYLDDGHRCSGDRWRAMRTAGSTVSGALFMMLTVFVLIEDPSAWLTAGAAMVGGLVGFAMWRAVGF